MDNLENTIYQDDNQEIIGKKIKSIPAPPPEIGIDVENNLVDNLTDVASSTMVDISEIEKFTSVSRSRDQVYNLIDSMLQDSTMAAALELYTEDCTEANDQGNIVWVESSDVGIQNYITYLLTSLNVNKNVYLWTNSLCKYGDIYLRLYRESEYQQLEDLFNGKKRKNLNEQIKINISKENDHYVPYIEMIANPAEVFELTRFGKSYGYIKTNVPPTPTNSNDMDYEAQFFQYNFKQSDVEVYSPTDFVHGCLQDNLSRDPEEVHIFMDMDIDNTNKELVYNVKRGQSLFYNIFKVWRELQLLEASVLLNRVTKSSIIRVVGVEVGDMPKENVRLTMMRIKQMVEQKSALNVGKNFTEYTNPGPIDNIIYVPTRNNIGNITTSQIGGDPDVKSLIDLDYFKDKLWSGLRIPKQFMGDTDDAAGFNGGTSLSLISSRYAKTIKRIQNVIIQTLTDVINLFLIDRGLENYIGKFNLKMLPPTTQEEVDRREAISKQIDQINTVMSMLDSIQDPATKLKLLKIQLQNAINDGEVSEIIQEEIDKLEAQEAEGETPESTENNSFEDTGELEGSSESESGSLNDFINNEIQSSEEPTTEEPSNEGEEEETLPTPADLDIDFTQNT